MTRKAVVFYYFILLNSVCRIELCSTDILQDVLLTADWDSLLVLCDVRTTERITDCPADDVLSVHPRPAVYISLDLTDHSAIVHMFETHATPTQHHWLVFCDHCETLLNEINTFERSHQLHGYLTYRYQWIMVCKESNLSSIQGNLGAITNIIVLRLNQNCDLYTAMFGQTRYLQQIHRDRQPLQKKELFPNLYTGMNNMTLIFTVVPWQPYIQKHNGSYDGYIIHLMNMIAKKL